MPFLGCLDCTKEATCSDACRDEEWEIDKKKAEKAFDKKLEETKKEDEKKKEEEDKKTEGT